MPPKLAFKAKDDRQTNARPCFSCRGTCHIVSICHKKRITLVEGNETEEVTKEPDFGELLRVHVTGEEVGEIFFIHRIKHAPVEPSLKN